MKNKIKKPKEPKFTLSEVIAVLEEALMRAEEDSRDMCWDDIHYGIDIDWDQRIYINNVDASDQIEDIFTFVNDRFDKLINSYVELRKENNN